MELKLHRNKFAFPTKLKDGFGKFEATKLQSYYPLVESFFKVEGIPTDKLKDLEMRVSQPIVKTILSSSLLELQSGEKVPYFTKHISLLNPFEYICGEYTDKLCLDSFNRSYSTFRKLNDKLNSAYVDVFLTQALSTLSDICPTFPKYYTTSFGVSDRYIFDITDDFPNLIENEEFQKNCGKSFELSVDFEFQKSPKPVDVSGGNVNTTVEEQLVWDVKSCHSCELGSEEESLGEDQPEQEESDEPILATIKTVPAAYVCMEKLDGTLFELGLERRSFYDKSEWKSWVFQIAFGLYVAQEKFKFFHNDLHSNNIMYTATKEQFLYFQFEGKVYKIPTFGRIMKIIDFGRSIATIDISGMKQPKILMCDLFRDDQEAAGQFNWGPQRNPDFPELEPNPSFDMVYLSISLLDIFPDIETDELKSALQNWVKDIDGNTIHEKENGLERFHGFDIYKAITRRCKNANPAEILRNSIFTEFLASKDTTPTDVRIFALDISN